MVDEKKIYLARQRLVDYLLLSEEIGIESDHLAWLNDKLYGLGVKVITDMPKAQSPSYDKTDELLTRRDEVMQHLNELIARQRKERCEIETIVCKIRSPKEKAVIRMRYLDSMSWDEVTNTLFGAELDFVEKEESYLRRTYKIHQSALRSIAS